MIFVIFVAEIFLIMKKMIFFAIAAFALVSCSHYTYRVAGDSDTGEHRVAIGYPSSVNTDKSKIEKVRVPERKGDFGVNYYLPEATAFRMSGDYSKNVAVTLSPDGELQYFPAPSDITADSEPIELGDGWWLNNQGLGPNSVFTKYTFAEYAALPEVPSPEQLKLSVIPGAKVTGFIELPVKIGEANNNIEELKKYVKGR